MKGAKCCQTLAAIKTKTCSFFTNWPQLNLLKLKIHVHSTWVNGHSMCWSNDITKATQTYPDFFFNHFISPHEIEGAFLLPLNWIHVKPGSPKSEISLTGFTQELPKQRNGARNDLFHGTKLNQTSVRFFLPSSSPPGWLMTSEALKLCTFLH